MDSTVNILKGQIDELNTGLDELNGNLKKYATYKNITGETNQNGYLAIGSITGNIPLSVTPITVGVTVSGITLNEYGIYYVITNISKSTITVRVLNV